MSNFGKKILTEEFLSFKKVIIQPSDIQDQRGYLDNKTLMCDKKAPFF